MSSLAKTPKDLDSERLFELIEMKLHLLTEMHSRTLEQTDFVATHDMNSLMSLLSRKQMLMDSLTEVQHQLSDFAHEDPELRNWSSIDRRKECQQMVARCEKLVSELLVMEGRSIDNMTLQRERVASQLLQNADASRIVQAYEGCEQNDDSSEQSISFSG